MVINQNTEDFCGYKISNTEGNKEFRDIINNLDFNGKFGEEYLDAKLTVLANIIHNKNDNAIINTIVYGRILLYGVKGALNRKDKDKYIFMCKAMEKLGYNYKDGLWLEDIRKNKAEIQSIRFVLEELGNVVSECA